MPPQVGGKTKYGKRRLVIEMKKPVLVAAALLVSAILLFAIFFRPPLHVDVLVFCYVWYNPEDPVSWEFPKIKETPVLGHYNSCDAEVIRQQLAEMDDLDIDGCIISWWGHYNETSWNVFINVATNQVFKTVEEKSFKVKICLMIEPFINKNQFPDWTYNITELLDHIYTQYVQPHRDGYYQYEGKPLVCLFNDSSLILEDGVPADNRFTLRTVGNNNQTCDWIYTDLPSNTSLLGKRQISVTPCFDDSGFRTPGIVIDPDLSGNVYSKQWITAIEAAKQNQVDVITICSWNEYVERTAIEPCQRATDGKDPYFLYEQTRIFIGQLRA